MLVQLEKNETDCFLCNTEELTKATKHILKSTGFCMYNVLEADRS